MTAGAVLRPCLLALLLVSAPLSADAQATATPAPAAAVAPSTSSAPKPTAAEPTAADLAQSAAVLDASDPETGTKGKPAEDAPDDVFEITWSTLVTASGGEPETNLQLDDSGWRVEDLLRPRGNKLYPSTSVSLYGEVSATDWLLFRGLLDTREIRDGATLEPPLDGLTMNGNSAADELGSGAALRELAVLIGSDALSIELGRFRADVAEGLVYEDFGAGLRVRADFDAMDVAPLTAELLLSTVGQRGQDADNNQLVALRVDYRLSAFEYLGAFMAVSNDQSGEVSEVLRSAYAENLLGNQDALSSLFLQDTGSGGHGYLGALAQITTADDAVLRLRLALSGGKLKLRVPLETVTTPEQQLDGRTITIDVGGLAADAELRYGLSDTLELAGFAFLLSGDRPPDQDGVRYRSFIGLAPYWVWSGLFFSGGLTQGLYPNRATAAGVNGRGVVGLGPALSFDNELIEAELRAVLLGAAADPPPAPLGGDSRAYGTELDWHGEWRALPFMRVGAELDVFFPGAFFPSRRVAYLTLVMVSLTNVP